MTARGSHGNYGSRRQGVAIILGVLFLVFLWELAARLSGQLAIASPRETVRAFVLLVLSDDFARHFGVSVLRMLAAIFLGGFAGFLLGLGAGASRFLYDFLEPLRWLTMSVPPVAVMVVILLWLGMGSAMVITLAAVILAPIIYVNTVEGLRMVDDNLREMAAVYRYSWWQRTRHMYIPALAAPLAAGTVHVICTGVRVVVLAELFGATDGAGAAIARANSTLEIPTLYAWIVLIVIVVAGLEFLFLRPVQQRALRWKTP